MSVGVISGSWDFDQTQVEEVNACAMYKFPCFDYVFWKWEGMESLMFYYVQVQVVIN